MSFPKLNLALAVAALVAAAAPADAGEADVIAVDVVRTEPGVYRVDVTVRHDDTGWDHYADKWDVMAPDGTLLGTRVLLHPHETEQPFTRSLGGVAIPESLDYVKVRAHDKVHGYGGKEMRFEMKDVK
ncbi:MAG: hypothetical protein RIM84_19370 [Alphaproteobacteria bacterium]